MTARLTIGITVLVLIPLTGGLYLLSRYQYEHTVAARQRAAELENRILEAALRHQMLRRDPGADETVEDTGLAAKGRMRRGRRQVLQRAGGEDPLPVFPARASPGIPLAAGPLASARSDVRSCEGA